MFNRSKSRLSYKASKLRMLGFPNINSHFFKDRKPLKEHIWRCDCLQFAGEISQMCSP